MAEYPKEMTPELREVLGQMIFRTGSIAHLLREAGETIEERVEAEQAFVLHWMIGLALEHGEAWPAKVADRLDAALATVKARAAAPKTAQREGT